MKNIKFLALVFSLPMFLHAAQLWIVGDDYVGFSKDGKTVQIIKDLPLSSSAFDKEQCQIWGLSKNNKLLNLDSDLKINEVDETGTILSEISDGKFYTRSAQEKIERRNSKGQILDVATVINSQFISEIHPLTTKPHAYLALNVDPTPNRLWFSIHEDNSSSPKNILVNVGTDLWGKARIHLDEANKQLWVGYSKSTLKHSYSPFVERYDLQGNRLNTYQWNAKGLYFDACLGAKDSLIVARDLPSPQFTVPVYSFFESLNPSGTIQKGLELETNLLVDSMACENNRVYYIAHSILSGSKSTVFEWTPGTNNGPTALFQLPSGASKLYSCPVK